MVDYNLFDGFELLNSRLTEETDKHHTIGQSFFMAELMTPELLLKIWIRKIKPLIEEFFFDQPDVAEEFTIEEFWP